MSDSFAKFWKALLSGIQRLIAAFDTEGGSMFSKISSFLGGIFDDKSTEEKPAAVEEE